MSVRLAPAAEHRYVAGHFAEVAAAAGPRGWDAPAPVPGWTARDVVGHLVDWFAGFLVTGSGIELPAVDVGTDPAGAWRRRAADVQALLDDEGDRRFAHPHTGEAPLAEAIDRFYTADVFMHTWDLARALGVEPELDEARCAEMLAGMAPVEEMLRASGQYGPRVPVPDGASAQDRLMGFIGRDPAWRIGEEGAQTSGQ